MRADKALEQSKDGKIYLDGKKAISADIPERRLLEHVSLTDMLSDKWEPCEGTEKCEACKEIDVIRNLWEACTIRSELDRLLDTAKHLSKYHCTCKK